MRLNELIHIQKRNLELLLELVHLEEEMTPETLQYMLCQR